MKIENIFHKNSGITMLALIVLIVILIILAGTSLTMVSGDKGIIGKSKIAKESTEQAQLKELVLEKWYECQRTYVNKTLDDSTMKSLFQEKLNQIEASSFTIVKSGNEYKVRYKGEDLVTIR